MAMALRSLISRSTSPLASLRLLVSASASLPSATRPAPFLRLRPLVSAAGARWSATGPIRGGAVVRCLSTRPTTSSLNDSSPNWSNRPPKETILLDGCDFEHWLVVMEPPEGEPTRDEIIDSYIKTLAQVVGSDEEARMKIYSVSTKHYFAFGALVSEELSYKIKALPRVRWVLPDSYLDVKNKDYGGEPFINGQAVPYDPKYHEEWVRNNARANERSRRNDRPRNFDRSRNFERRRENMQNRDFQSRFSAPVPNQQPQSTEVQNPLPPRDMPPSPNAQGTMPPVPPPSSGGSPSYAPPNMPPPPPSSGGAPGYAPPNMPPPPPSSGGAPGYAPPNMPYSNTGAMPSPSFQGTPNRDYQNQGPSYQGNYVPNRDGGGMPGAYQGGGVSYQGSGSPPQGVGNSYQGGGGSYQGGGNAYQGGRPGGYPGGGNAYQGGGGNAYQGGGSYQGGGNAYQGGGSYQGSGHAYQGDGGGGGGGGYTGGGNAYEGGGGSLQSSGNTYQGRDMPGRD